MQPVQQLIRAIEWRDPPNTVTTVPSTNRAIREQMIFKLYNSIKNSDPLFTFHKDQG